MANKIDNKAFQSMITSSEADVTAASLFPQEDSDNWSQNVHNTLMATGMAPGIGNVADIADAVLYAAEGEFGSAGLSAAAAIPLVGQGITAKKVMNILADQKLLNPIKKGPGSVTIQHVTNQLLEYLGKNSNYKKLGDINFKGTDYAISVTERSIPNIADKGHGFIDRLKKVIGDKDSYGSEELLKAIKGDQRPAKIIKMTNKKTGEIIYQPFYRSTGRGVPEIKSKGKWIPFEGVLPLGNKVNIIGNKGEMIVKAKDAILKHDFGPGEMPMGWVIKGFKSPTTGKIIDSSIGGVSKEGLKIHQDIGKLLQKEIY